MTSPWILASRPKTLVAAVAPVVVGAALAFAGTRRVDWSVFAYTLLSAIFIQIGTNLVNDALDFRKGTDTAQRLGPLRVTQAGLLTPKAVLRGAGVAFVIATLFGVPLILRGGLPILIIGLLSIAAAYAYTGGPYPLAYHGLGEIFVITFFGVVAVAGTYYLQTLTFDRSSVVAGVAVGCLAAVLLSINNVRDIEEDRASGKRTLAVRVGPQLARLEVALFAITPFVLMARLVTVLLALPLAIVLIRCVYRSDGAALNRCLGMAAALQATFALFIVLDVVFLDGINLVFPL